MMLTATYMNTKSFLLVFPVVLICAAVFRPKSNFKVGTKLETSVRQETRQGRSCDSKFDCFRDQVCVSNSGICNGSDCNGSCFQESAFTSTCSCQNPCSSDFTCSSRKVEGVEIRVCLPDSLSDFVPDDVADSLTSPFSPLDCSSPSPSPSPRPRPSTEPGDREPCIGVDMLSDFSPHGLVYDTHILSTVLCDETESCATKGHIVHYNGKAMMMKTYCDLVGCKDKVMEVNSPIYMRGLKVPSRSDNMHFTAFSARYQTRVEEIIMSAAVRIGL